MTAYAWLALPLLVVPVLVGHFIRKGGANLAADNAEKACCPLDSIHVHGGAYRAPELGERS
jgi:hypothetical protein